jgi:hypothetical protein
LPMETIKMTFSETTQYAHLPFNTVLWKWYKSPHPALNIMQCSELVATDMITWTLQLLMVESRHMSRDLLECTLWSQMYMDEIPHTVPWHSIQQHHAMWITYPSD